MKIQNFKIKKMSHGASKNRKYKFRTLKKAKNQRINRIFKVQMNKSMFVKYKKQQILN